MYTVTTHNEEQIREAFRCICSLAHSSTKQDHYATNCVFHIKPFNTHWDSRTVEEVMESVRQYVRTWILSPLSDALDLSEDEVVTKMKINYHKAEAERLAKKLQNAK